MKSKNCLLGVLFILVSACGGSGSGSSGGNNPQPTVQLNSGNAAEIASSSISADSVASAPGGIAAFSVGQQSTDAQTLTEFTRRLLRLDQAQNLQPQIFTELCVSGYVDEPAPDATSGTFTFYDCVIDGLTINGSMSFSFSGDANNYSVSATYSDFTFDDGVDAATIDATLSISVSVIGDTETASISIQNFSVTVNSDYVHLYGYTAIETTDSIGNTTVSMSYTIESSLIGGVVLVTTDPAEGGQPIQQDFADPYPHSGSVVIIGMNSRVRVSANGDGSASGTVTIEVDANGDGIYEDLIIMNWLEFTLLSTL